MTDRAPTPVNAARICPNCHGFASAHVTSGGRDAHGHLHTLTVDCRVCHGTGTVPAHRSRTTVWEVAA